MIGLTGMARFVTHRGAPGALGGVRNLPALAVTGLLALTSACGKEFQPCPPSDSGDEALVEPSAAIRDSSGVLIVESPCSAMDRPMPWEVDPNPEFDVGDEASGVFFNRIRGIESYRGHWIAVADRRTHEVVFLTWEGAVAGRLGGQGQGPSEHRSPVLVPAPDSDSVWIYNSGGRRIQVYPDGPDVPARTVRSAVPHFHRPLGLLGDWVLVEQWIDPIYEEPGAQVRDFVFEWASLTGEIRRPIHTTSVVRYFMVANGTPFTTTIPFSLEPRMAVVSDGALLVTGKNFVVSRFDVDGNLTHRMKVDRRRSPVTTQRFSEFRQALADRGGVGENWWPRFEQEGLPLPDSVPGFTNVLADASGWIWAEVEGWDLSRPTRWLVFDPDGRAHGHVTVPAGLDLHEVGDDYVLGRWTGPMGVERVRRHSLRRGEP